MLFLSVSKLFGHITLLTCSPLPLIMPLSMEGVSQSCASVNVCKAVNAQLPRE